MIVGEEKEMKNVPEKKEMVNISTQHISLQMVNRSKVKYVVNDLQFGKRISVVRGTT